MDTSIRTVSLWCVCLLLSEVNSVYSEQTLVASWANAAKPSPNRHYVPVCEQKKWIPIYLQANRLINLRGLCVLPDREALWENHHLSRVRCGFHCDVIEPVLLIARAYDFIQENKVPYVLWAKEEHQPASWTLIFSETQSETRSFKIRRCLKMQLLLWLDMWLHKCQSLSRLAAI